MKIINKLWSTLVALIKLTDKVDRLEDTVRRQQQKIESQNERLIRLETALQLGALKAISNTSRFIQGGRR